MQTGSKRRNVAGIAGATNTLPHGKKTLVGSTMPGDNKRQLKPFNAPPINDVNNANNNDNAIDTHVYDYMDDDEHGHRSHARVDVCDLWYKKRNCTHRMLRIFFISILEALWYETIVGVGFRMLGNSWSFGLLQGFTFASMVGLLWYEDFGFANVFIAMGLCFMRQLRSREYWIFFIHLAGYLVGGSLAMAAVVLITNDLPGLQTFGTPTKSTLISETAAGFAEFTGTFLMALLVFLSVYLYNDSVKVRHHDEYERQEKRRIKRHHEMPYFTVVLGLAYTALSIGFYDLTGSSFNFLRWAIPRLCMGHFDVNPHDALYYLVANFIAIALAGVIVYLFMLYKRSVERTFLRGHHALDVVNTV